MEMDAGEKRKDINMRKLYIKRERVLACFGINYRCIVGENVQDHLAWAAAQDRYC
jgi:hypothetical protein